MVHGRMTVMIEMDVAGWFEGEDSNWDVCGVNFVYGHGGNMGFNKNLNV